MKDRYQSILVTDPNYSRKIMGGFAALVTGNKTVDSQSVANITEITPGAGLEFLIPPIDCLSVRAADADNASCIVSTRDVDIAISFLGVRTTSTAIGRVTFAVDQIVEGQQWQDVTPTFYFWNTQYFVDGDTATLSTIIPLPKGFGLYFFNDTDSGDFASGLLVAKPLQPA